MLFPSLVTSALFNSLTTRVKLVNCSWKPYLSSTNGLTSIYGYVEERMLYSLIYFLWRPDVPVSCCKVKCVDLDRQDDSTDHEKRVCSDHGFQHTCTGKIRPPVSSHHLHGFEVGQLNRRLTSDV